MDLDSDLAAVEGEIAAIEDQLRNMEDQGLYGSKEYELLQMNLADLEQEEADIHDEMDRA